jgi:hypothetical protein
MKRIIRAPIIEALNEKATVGEFSWRFDWDELCKRCFIGFFVPKGQMNRCSHCGMAEGRVVKRIRRKNIGGKYGRNSGKVQTAK